MRPKNRPVNLLPAQGCDPATRARHGRTPLLKGDEDLSYAGSAILQAPIPVRSLGILPWTADDDFRAFCRLVPSVKGGSSDLHVSFPGVPEPEPTNSRLYSHGHFRSAS